MMQNRPSAVRTRVLRLSSGEPGGRGRAGSILSRWLDQGEPGGYPGRPGDGLGDPDSGPGGPAPGASAKYAKLEG